MIFEVVTGQILLNRRNEFFELHSRFLLPIMKEIGIKPKILLITDIGRYLRFLDIYEYGDLAEYGLLSNRLANDERLIPYYEKVGPCIFGGISIEIMSELPYAGEWL
jgi:hypothetical protein